MSHEGPTNNRSSLTPPRECSVGRRGTRGGVAYLLQVFPKYSETFILNELLEHQRQGRTLPVLSLRSPRDGRFHAYLAQLQEPAQYVPENLWEQPGKVRQAAWAAIKAAPRGTWRGLRHRLAGQIESRDLWQAALVRRWADRRNVAHVHCHFGGFAAHGGTKSSSTESLTKAFSAEKH